MARDPLLVLWRLREAAVATATRELAAALAEERAAADRLAAHEARLRAERDDAGVELIADFAAWLPHAKRHAEHLRAALDQARARVGSRRDGLAARRTEAEALAKVRARQIAEAASRRARQDQAIIDEIAATRHSPAAP